MVHYFEPITSDTNNYIYSCDNLRISFVIREDELDNFRKIFDDIFRLDVNVYRPCFTSFKYKYMLTVDYGYSTMTVGWNFNGVSRDDLFKGFIDVNPNKCFGNPNCFRDLSSIRACCEGYSFDIARCDIAIDIPYNRKYFRLNKDKRKYKLEMNSQEDKTEYLGTRNEGGYVKLYNKTIESKLDYDLTRLEITFDKLDKITDTIDYIVPDVYIQEIQRCLNFDDSLSQTQRVLVDLIKDSDNPDYYLKQLGSHVACKLRPYVFTDDKKVEVDSVIVNKIVTNIKRKLYID